MPARLPRRIVAFAFLSTALGGQHLALGAHPSERARTAFTVAQSMLGKTVFIEKCAACHSIDEGKPPPVGLAGEGFRSRWRSANDLFSKISMTMPADKVLSMSVSDNINVLAYLLSLNGFQAGDQRLDARREALNKWLLMPPIERQGEFGKTLAKSGGGYYGTAQARRGEAYFQASCSLCHIAEAKAAIPGEIMDKTFANVSITPSQGVRLGSLHAKSHLAGPIFIANWLSVGALYNRIRYTMPGDSPDGLDPETYLDITAYILKVNGLTAGETELPLDIHQLKAMPLPEPNFKVLFNGEDFTGFGFVVGSDCSPQPDGCASTSPGPTFAVKDRAVASSGHPYGYMYTLDQYLNFTLRFEYRFPPWQGMESDDVFWGNSGYFLFIAKHEVWPKSIEIEGQETIILRPLGIATMPRYTYDTDAAARARRPVGQWNTVEIKSKDGQIQSSLNGILISVITEHEFIAPGHLAFQAEGAPIEWRNIRIAEE